MAKIETTYYLLSQSQLNAMLVDVVVLCDSYQDKCTKQEAMEMAVSDVFYGLDRYTYRPFRKPILSKLRYYLYKKRTWKNNMAAMSYDEWIRRK